MFLKMLQIRMKNGDKELLVGSDCAIKIVSVEGLEASEYELHTTSNANAPGSKKTGQKVQERLLVLNLATDDMDNREVLRDQMIHFFNPFNLTHIEVNYCGKKASIEAEIASFKPPTEISLWDPYEANITFKCPYPFFADLDNFGRNLASTTKMWAYPLAFMTFNRRGAKRSGQISSYMTLTDEVVLHNRGDVETGLEIEFTATRGAVTNPKITNILTGEFIEIIAEMKIGDTIKINTNVGQKNIWHNGEQIYKKKNKMSTFFYLKVGDNKVAYSAQKNRTNLDVRIYYTPKYLGV